MLNHQLNTDKCIDNPYVYLCVAENSRAVKSERESQ